MATFLFSELDSPQGQFHTRNPMPSADVARGRAAAQTQAERILAFFQERPGQRFTPFQVLKAIDLHCPITSVRRAMTDLTKHGFLQKHADDQRPGEFGMSNCTWSLRNAS